VNIYNVTGTSSQPNDGSALTQQSTSTQSDLIDMDEAADSSTPNKKQKLCKKKKELNVNSMSDYCGLKGVQLSKHRLLQAVVELCTVNGRPFTILNDTGMRLILDPIIDAMPEKFKLNAENLPNLINEEASKTRKEITDMFRNQIFSLKIDCVTRLDRGFLGVNIQRVVNGRIRIRCLGCVELFQQHTSQYLFEEIKKLMHLYELTFDQLYSVTYDNGRNMVRAGKILDQVAVDLIYENMSEFEVMNKDAFEIATEEKISGVFELLGALDALITDAHLGIHEIRCVAHSLQLAIEDAMKEIKANNLGSETEDAEQIQDAGEGDGGTVESKEKAVLKRVRNQIKKLRTPKYKKLISDFNLDSNDIRLHAPVLDMPTRWCSTLDMLNSCLEYKIFSTPDHLLASDANFLLTSDEYGTIDELVNVLKYPKEATILLQAEQLTLSDMYLIWKQCLASVSKINTNFAHSLANKIKSREANLIENQSVLAAVYLDPRIQVLLSKEQVKIAQEHLILLGTKLCYIRNKEHLTLQNVETVASPDEENEIDDDPLELELRVKEREKQNGSRCFELLNFDASQIETEIRNFAECPREKDRTKSIFKIWHDLRSSFPNLHDIAMIVLGAPPTQVSVERLFSGLKFIMNPLRNNMSSETVNNIMVVRTNNLHKRNN
jgi:hAT family C-terminal dimerisation region